MLTRFFIIAAFAIVLSGCATSSKTVPPTQAQTQLTELQQRIEDQEKEIVDLKYEVKELASKADERENEAKAPAPVVIVKNEPVKSSENRSADIIHVAGVTPQELQKALKAAGLYEGKIDGKLGPKTRAAVIEFQKAHSLKADGVVGQKTWSELKAVLSAPAESAEGEAETSSK